MPNLPFFSMGPRKARLAIVASSSVSFVPAIGIGIDTALATFSGATFAARGASFARSAASLSGTSSFSFGGDSVVGVNQPPVWNPASVDGTVFTIYQGGTLSLNNALRFTDPDGDPLTYALVSGTLPSGVTLDTDTGVLTASGSATLGESGNLVVSADDGYGNVVSTDVHTLTLAPTSTGVLPYMATAFPLEGVVPSGQIIVSPDDSNLRSSILSTWPDGSAKVVVVAGEIQVFSASTKTIRLQNGADPGGSLLTSARIAAIVTNITCNFGGGAQSLTSFTSPEYTWWSNPSHVCCRYRLNTGLGTMQAVIDIHAFRAGVSNRAFVEVVIENCLVNAALSTVVAPSAQTYTGATVAVNGTTIATVDSSHLTVPGGSTEPTHQALRAWYASTWVGGDPGIEVTHDTASMQAHPMMHKVWKASDQNLQTIYENDVYEPWSKERLNVPGMGGTGDAAGIGSFSQWDSRYLQSGSKYVRRACIANGLAALSGNINFRDQTTGLVPAFSQINLKNTQASTWPSQGGEPGWEHAHSPSVGFMAFMCRPSPCFIEVSQKAAVWQRTYGNNTDVDQKRPLGSSYQVRGKAWTLRAWNQAMFLTPTSMHTNMTAWNTACQTTTYGGLQFLIDYDTDPYNPLDLSWDYAPWTSPNVGSGFYWSHNSPGFQIAMFEHHYLAVEAIKGAMSKVVAPGTQQALYDSVADWGCKHVLRVINESVAGEWRAISRYDWPVGNAVANPIGTLGDGTYNSWWANWYSDSPPAATGPWLGIGGGGTTTWASASAVSDTSGAYYDSYFWANLCMAVERGVSGADAAWTKLTSGITNLDSGGSPWSSKFAAEPRWGFFPRNKSTTIVPTSYSTTFSLTENPISESGKWVNGGTVGGNWRNVQTTGGAAYGGSFVTGYDDPIAHLSTSFLAVNANQYAEGVVRRVVGYSPGVSHEIELLLRFAITSGNARGYEILWGHAGGGAVVRWNGGLGLYTPILDNRPWGAAVEGDVLRAEISGNTITIFKNGIQVDTCSTVISGSVWTDGQPGVGFWPQSGSTLASYGWKDFTAGNL